MRKKARESRIDRTLIEFEQYIKSIWAFLPTPIAYVSPSGVILDSDTTLEQMLHCPREKLVGRLLEEFFPERDKVARLQRETAKHGVVRNFVCSIANGDGLTIPVSISTLARHSDSGEIIGYFAAFTDISENQRIEDILRSTTSQQRKLLESARYLVESLDTHEVLTRIATSAREIVRADGCTIYLIEADRKTLKPVVAISPPYNEAILSTQLSMDSSFTGRAITAKKAMVFNDTAHNPLGQQIPGTPDEENEHLMVAPFVLDGETIGAMCLDRHGKRFNDGDLVVCEMFATYAATALRNARTYQDLQQEVERREAVQRALQVEKEYFEQLFESADEAIAVTSLDGRIHHINNDFTRLFGYAREEVEGEPLDTIVAPKELLDEARLFTARAGRGEHLVWETVRRRKDGTLLDVSVLAAPIIVNQEPVAVYAIYRDITSRKLAERTLREKEEKYRSLFQHSNDAILIHDLAGNIIDFNDGVLRLFGYKKDEVRVLKIAEVHPVDQRKKFEQALKDVAAKGTVDIEVNLFRKNGDIFLAEVSSSLIEVGGSKMVQAVVRDISERREAETRLRESEERYRELVEKAGAAVLIDDRTGRLQYCNKRLAELFGYTMKEMQGRDFWSIVHPDDIDRVKKIRGSMIRGRRQSAKYEFRGLKKQRETIYVEVDAVAQRKGEKVIGTRSYIWDITELKHTEEEIRSSEERLKVIFEYAPDGYYLMDLKGNFIDGNKAAEEMTGHAKNELIGKNFVKSKLLSADQIPKALSLLTRNSLGQRTGPDEFVLTRKDGSRTIVGISTFPVKMGGQTVILGTAHDMTDYRRTQDELRKSYEKMHSVLNDTINALTFAVEKRDPYTAGHQQRVAVLADAIAERLGLPGDQKEGLHVAALVHDVGKINVPAGILNKPTSLTDAEFALVRDHVVVGYDILRTIEFPWPIAEMVLQHHERLDGSGYPRGTKESGIMLEAKILAVADTVESMTAHRPYRPALGKEKAIAELVTNKKKYYDPEIVKICIKLLRDRKFRFRTGA